MIAGHRPLRAGAQSAGVVTRRTRFGAGKPARRYGNVAGSTGGTGTGGPTDAKPAWIVSGFGRRLPVASSSWRALAVETPPFSASTSGTSPSVTTDPVENSVQIWGTGAAAGTDSSDREWPVRRSIARTWVESA